MRQAVLIASNGDTINFLDSLEGTISITTPISITQNLTIAGNSYKSITIDGGGLTSIFDVGDLVTVRISELSFENGAGNNGGAISLGQNCDAIISNCNINACAALNGGGIYAGNSTDLSIINVQISACEAANNGGAICGDSVLTMTLSRSTLSNNLAVVSGGGIYSINAWSTSILNSTLSSNSAPSGAGVELEATSNMVFPFNEITHSTLANNGSNPGETGVTVTDFVGFSSTTISYSIFENDSNYNENGFPIVGSGGYNIASDSSMSGFFGGLDQNKTSALLEPIDGNGGLGLTHALQALSPAIDAGLGSTFSVDQRGYGRNGVRDIGAFENRGIPQDTSIMINEMDCFMPGQNQEFIELFDGGDGHTCLNGMVLTLIDGATDQVYAVYDLDSMQTAHDGYFVIGSAGTPNVDMVIPDNTIQDGEDAAALYFGNADEFPVASAASGDNVIDGLVYDTSDPDDAILIALLTPGQIQINEDTAANAATESMQRVPNGSGGRRVTSTYYNIPPTPGAENLCANVNAGEPDTASICETNTMYNLFDVLGGTYDAGGIWSDDDATGQLTDSVLMATGLSGSYHFTYHVSGPGPCQGDSTAVVVQVSELANAGLDSTVALCENSSSVDLHTLLGGNPDQGGLWLDDDATGQVTDSILDASGLGGGSYDFTYIVVGGCPNDSATVTVNAEALPDGGQDSAVVVCESTTNLDLNTVLGGSADGGGTWNDDDATGQLLVNIFDATSLGGSTYDFTYTVTGTICPDSSATVAVTVVTSVSAGGDSTSSICASDSTAILDSLLTGTPTPGGSWFDDDASGQLSGNEVDITTLNGTYNFTYKQTPTGCPRDSATVTINVSPVANGGQDSSVTICETEMAYDLSGALAGTPDGGGTWNDDNTTGQLSGSNFDASGLGGSSYNFTYNVTGGQCPDSAATVTVNVGNSVDAGTGSTLVACEAEDSLNLHGGLTGNDVGGIWTDFSATGQLTDSLLDCSGLGGSSYQFYYVLLAGAGCPDDSSLVTVDAVSTPNAGLDGTLTACETNTNIGLAAGLGGSPQMGGTWNDDDVTGSLSGSSVDGTGLGGGTYNFTYTVSAVGCPDSSATVALTIENQGTAGSDNDTIICLNVSLDLWPLLGPHSGGGTWSDDDATGRLQDSTFNALGQGIGTYNFTYTVTGNTCADDDATISVQIVECMGIDEILSGSDQLRIYPNPGSGLFTLELQDADLSNTLIRIAGIDGRVVWSQTIDQPTSLFREQIDITGLTDGIYYLQIANSRGQASERIIKQ